MEMPDPDHEKVTQSAGLGHAPLLGLLGFYLTVVFFTFNQIEEDAFIYFRLAANLAEGHGYVFNLGGERIESGSGLLWQFLLALAWLLPFSIIPKAKLLGIAFGALCLWLTQRIARRLIADPLLQYVPSLLLTCSIPFFCWVQRGLETPFYVAMLLLLCWFCLEERLRRWWYLPAVGLCASRPEGFLALLSVAPFLVLYRKRVDGLWRGVLIVAGIFALMTLFRLWYFHDPFPHPFYIKAVASGAGRWHKLSSYLLDNHLIYLMLPALLPYFSARGWNRQVAVVSGFAATLVGWTLLIHAGPWDPYDRHLTPALPFVFLLTARGLEQLSPSRLPPWPLTAICVAFALVMLCFGGRSEVSSPARPSLFSHSARIALADPVAYSAEVWQILVDPDAFATTHPQQLHGPIGTNYQAATGQFIALNYPENITLVYDQMGQTPWYAGRDKTVIDSYGLLDKKLGYQRFRLLHRTRIFELYDEGMTRLASKFWPDEPRRMSNAGALHYIFSYRPELILVNQFVASQNPRSAPAQLRRSKRLRRDYTLAYRISNFVEIYERNDLSSPEPIQVPPGLEVETLRER